jgi:hypothetical protein
VGHPRKLSGSDHADNGESGARVHAVRA